MLVTRVRLPACAYRCPLWYVHSLHNPPWATAHTLYVRREDGGGVALVVRSLRAHANAGGRTAGTGLYACATWDAYKRTQCSGIIQASHACDPGSTPGVRTG